MSEAGTLPAGLTFTDNGDGTATLAGVPTTAGNYPLIFTATNGAGADGVQTFTLIVDPARASQLAFTQQPGTTTAGTSIGTMTVAVEDAYGNVITADHSTVTLASSSAFTGTTSVTAANGVATFTGLSMTLAGNHTFTASADSLALATSSVFTITPAAGIKLAIAQQSGDAVAGQSIGTIIVNVEDTYGNIVTSDISSVALSTTSAINGTASVSAIAGGATFTGLSLNHAGTYTLTATDGSLVSATSNSFTIVPAAATQLVIAQQPTDSAAGVSIGTTIVDVEDAYGNLATGDTSTVSLATADGTALKGTIAVAAVGGVAIFPDLSITKAGTYVLNATDAGLAQATTTSVTITALPTPPPVAVIIAGKQLAPIAIDPASALGQAIVHTKLLTISIQSQSSDGAPVLTRKVRLKHGQITITNLNLHKAGDYTLVVSDAQGNSMTETFTISPAAPSRLAFITQPTFANGKAAVSVQVLDRYGNAIVSADGMTVTLHLATLLPKNARQLSGTTTATVVDGIATFSNVQITRIGRGRLIATSPKLVRGLSHWFVNA